MVSALRADCSAKATLQALLVSVFAVCANSSSALSDQTLTSAERDFTGFDTRLRPKPTACGRIKTDDGVVGRIVNCRDHSDCTQDLQAAIDSGDDIKLAAGVWTVQPVYFRSSNQTITFGKDVEIVAKRMVNA